MDIALTSGLLQYLIWIAVSGWMIVLLLGGSGEIRGYLI
jgi:hypothetical protein